MMEKVMVLKQMSAALMTYDTFKKELLKQKSAENCTTDTKQINDINLNAMLNGSNNEFIKDYLQTTKIIEMLNEEHKAFSSFRRIKQNCPRMAAVLLLRMIGKMYYFPEPSHPVITPALTFIADILCSEFHHSYNNIVTRLLMIDIALDYIAPSKVFVPEALYFLKTVLELVLPEMAKVEKSQKCYDLVLGKTASVKDILKALQLNPSDKISNLGLMKVNIVFTITRQVFQFASLYSDYQTFKMIFTPFLEIFSKFPLHLCPSELEFNVKRLIKYLQETAPSLRYLSLSLKPQPLKMFEPAFECNYESIEKYERQLGGADNIFRNRHRNDANNQKRLNRVKQKIRKEQRGFLRDIRKSSQIAAGLKLELRQEQDKERQRKTKDIYHELAMQEGEYKKILRKK